MSEGNSNKRPKLVRAYVQFLTDTEVKDPCVPLVAAESIGTDPNQPTVMVKYVRPKIRCDQIPKQMKIEKRYLSSNHFDMFVRHHKIPEIEVCAFIKSNIEGYEKAWEMAEEARRALAAQEGNGASAAEEAPRERA
jgi:hypothetical protein